MFGQYSDCRSATVHYEQLWITLIDDDGYFAYCAVPLCGRCGQCHLGAVFAHRHGNREIISAIHAPDDLKELRE